MIIIISVHVNVLTDILEISSTLIFVITLNYYILAYCTFKFCRHSSTSQWKTVKSKTLVMFKSLKPATWLARSRKETPKNKHVTWLLLTEIKQTTATSRKLITDAHRSRNYQPAADSLLTGHTQSMHKQVRLSLPVHQWSRGPWLHQVITCGATAEMNDVRRRNSSSSDSHKVFLEWCHQTVGS